MQPQIGCRPEERGGAELRWALSSLRPLVKRNAKIFWLRAGHPHDGQTTYSTPSKLQQATDVTRNGKTRRLSSRFSVDATPQMAHGRMRNKRHGKQRHRLGSLAHAVLERGGSVSHRRRETEATLETPSVWNRSPYGQSHLNLSGPVLSQAAHRLRKEAPPQQSGTAAPEKMSVAKAQSGPMPNSKRTTPHTIDHAPG